jgi:hypothetical protein
LAKAASNTIVSLLPKLPLLVLLHGSDSANAAVSTAVIALRNVHPVGVALSPPSLTEIEIAPAFTAPSAKVMPRARGQRCEADAIAMAITVDRDQWLAVADPRIVYATCAAIQCRTEVTAPAVGVLDSAPKQNGPHWRPV